MALFPRDQGLLQRDLSLVKILVSDGIFQFEYSLVFSGIVHVCMYGRNLSQNFVGTIYPFGVLICF